MNHFFEYVCRSVIRSEDAINQLGKNVTKLAKCCRRADTCVALAGLCILAVVAMQDKEIKELQKKVADLTAKTETHDTMEEQTEQEGA